MTPDFDRAVAIVLDLEGGVVTDSGDLTKYGIAKRFHPDLDIANLTIDHARVVYFEDYWTPTGCAHLPWPVDAVVLDAAVNQGVGAAARMLQKVARVKQDGLIGPKTLRAVGAFNRDELVALYLAERALRYMGTRNFDIDGRGWLKRLFRLSAAVVV